MLENLQMPLAPLALGVTHWLFIIPICLLSIFLTLLILVQRGRGGGLTGALGGMGGQSAFGAKAGDLFTKITIVTAMIWILLSMGALKILHVGVFGNGVAKPAAKTPDKTGTDKTGTDKTGTDKTGTSTIDPLDTKTAPGITPETAPVPVSPAPAEPPATPAAPSTPAPEKSTDK